MLVNMAVGDVATVETAGTAVTAVAPEWSGWRPSHNPWAVALTVTLATFMEVLDSSIANVALRHIAGGFSAGQDESTWVLTSYLVSNAVVLPISAWLATRFGRKRFYMTCVAVFTASSFLCGLAPSLGMLIFFRDSARRGRRRTCAQRAGDSCRHVCSVQTWDCLRGLRDGRGCSSCHWPDAGRMDH